MFIKQSIRSVRVQIQYDNYITCNDKLCAIYFLVQLIFIKNNWRHTDVSATVAEDILEKQKAGEEEHEKAGQHN